MLPYLKAHKTIKIDIATFREYMNRIIKFSTKRRREKRKAAPPGKVEYLNMVYAPSVYSSKFNNYYVEHSNMGVYPLDFVDENLIDIVTLYPSKVTGTFHLIMLSLVVEEPHNEEDVKNCLKELKPLAGKVIDKYRDVIENLRVLHIYSSISYNEALLEWIFKDKEKKSLIKFNPLKRGVS